jgi:hypothetical protein
MVASGSKLHMQPCIGVMKNQLRNKLQMLSRLARNHNRRYVFVVDVD